MRFPCSDEITLKSSPKIRPQIKIEIFCYNSYSSHTSQQIIF